MTRRFSRQLVVVGGAASLAFLGLLPAACARSADGEGRTTVEVADAVVGASGGTEAAAYMVLRAEGSGDELVGVDVVGDGTATMHATVTSGGRTSMRTVGEMAIPADGELRLDPGGSHLMIDGLRRPVLEGDRLTLVLRFEHAPDMQVELEAVALQTLPDRMDGNRP